jgi:hypothetical protein
MTFDQKRSLVEALSTELGAGAEPYVVLIDGPSLGLEGRCGASDIPRGRAPPSSGPGPGPTGGRVRALDRCLLEDYRKRVSQQLDGNPFDHLY